MLHKILLSEFDFFLFFLKWLKYFRFCVHELKAQTQTEHACMNKSTAHIDIPFQRRKAIAAVPANINELGWVGRQPTQETKKEV